MGQRLDMNAYSALIRGTLRGLVINQDGDLRNDFLSTTSAVLRQRFANVNGFEHVAPDPNSWAMIYECLTRRKPPLTRANINAADALLREEEFTDLIQFALNEFQEDDRLTALVMLVKAFGEFMPYYEEKRELFRQFLIEKDAYDEEIGKLTMEIEDVSKKVVSVNYVYEVKQDEEI